MPNSRSIDRAKPPVWWESGWLWAALAIAAMVPFIFAAIPMMPDLHSHIGRYHVMMNAADPELARYYKYDWQLKSNLGMDALIWLFAHLMDVETTAHFVASLIPPLMIAGIYTLSRAATGGVAPTALLSLPLVWSFPFTFGFVNFCLGTAIAFLCAAAWISLGDRRRARIAMAIAASILLWLCHLATLGIFLVIITSHLFVAGMRSQGTLAARFLPLLIDFLPACVFPILLTINARLAETSAPMLMNWTLSLKPFLAASLFHEVSKTFDRVFVVIFLSLVLLAVGGNARHWRETQPALLLAGCILCCLFLIIPTSIMGSYYADLRLLPSGLILVLIALPLVQSRAGEVLASIGLVLFIVRLSATTIDWHSRSVLAQRELKALEHVPHGARIASFAHASGGCANYPFTGYDHLASRAIARRSAFVNTQWYMPDGSAMQPVYNRGRDFNDSVSATIVPIGGKCDGYTLEQRLAALPRDRFDFVWVFDHPFNERGYTWLKPVYRGPTGVLFAVH